MTQIWSKVTLFVTQRHSPIFRRPPNANEQRVCSWSRWAITRSFVSFRFQPSKGNGYISHSYENGTFNLHAHLCNKAAIIIMTPPVYSCPRDKRLGRPSRILCGACLDSWKYWGVSSGGYGGLHLPPSSYLHDPVFPRSEGSDFRAPRGEVGGWNQNSQLTIHLTMVVKSAVNSQQHSGDPKVFSITVIITITTFINHPIPIARALSEL